MSTYTYRVSVERIEHDDDGDFTRSTTLFEASSPNAGRLNGFAPDEVASALHDVSDPEPTPTAVPEPVLENAPEADATETSAPARPTRKRRTKAEIEADRLAAEGMAVAADTVVEQEATPLAAVPDLPQEAPAPAAEPTPAPYNPFLPK